MIKSKIEKIYQYIPFLLFLVYALWIHWDVDLYSDDLFYQPSLENISLFSWCKEFYQLWGGRVPLQLLDIIFLNLPLLVWKISNSIIYALVPCYISKIVQLFWKNRQEQEIFLLNLWICILLIFLPKSIVDNAVIWITGSFNYLFPAAMLLVGLYVFFADVVGQKVSKADAVLAWFGVFFAVYAEQTAAVFLCMAGFCFAYAFFQKKKIAHSHIFPLVFGIVHALIQFLAPGNAVRYEAELLKWYPEFDMFHLFDKVLIGLVHFMKEVVIAGSVFFWVLLLFLGIAALKKSRLYQCSYLLLCVLTFFVQKISDHFEDGVIWQVYSKRTLLEIFLMLFWVLLFAWFIFCVLPKVVSGIVASLLFLAVVASGVVMGMSPTIYVSGERVFLPCYLLLILLMALVFASAFSEKNCQ